MRLGPVEALRVWVSKQCTMGGVMESAWFQDRVAVVTGGGSGIGRATVHKLSDVGTARVVIADVVEENARKVAAEVGARAVPLPTDVSRPEDVQRLVTATLNQFGRLDFLVNCAGNALDGPVVDTAFEDWCSVLDVHLTGTFLCCKAAAEAIAATQGRIVSISSTYAFKGRPNGASYSAAKAGIVALTKVLAAELAPNVNVNAIAPGPIDTPRWRAGLTEEQYLARRAARIQDIPLGRMGQPEDVADAALFLLGPGSRWITGTVLFVTGGEFQP